MARCCRAALLRHTRERCLQVMPAVDSRASQRCLLMAAQMICCLPRSLRRSYAFQTMVLLIVMRRAPKNATLCQRRCRRCL